MTQPKIENIITTDQQIEVSGIWRFEESFVPGCQPTVFIVVLANRIAELLSGVFKGFGGVDRICTGVGITNFIRFFVTVSRPQFLNEPPATCRNLIKEKLSGKI